MTREKLWSLYCERNPSFTAVEPDAVVKLSPATMKKMFDQIWDFAEASGAEKGKACGERDVPRPTVGARDFFNGLFGQ